MSMDGDTLGQEAFDAVNALSSGATEADALARMKALCNAIVDHISSNATIGSLATTSTPTDGPGHIHAPITVESTGDIS